MRDHVQPNSVERRLGDERISTGCGIVQYKVRSVELALYGRRRTEGPVTQRPVRHPAAFVMVCRRIRRAISIIQYLYSNLSQTKQMSVQQTLLLR